MTRVCIVCEGLTETNFVEQCLAPHLAVLGVYVYASILQAPSGNHKGGRVTVERLVKHLSHKYREFDRLTTLVDFYGFKDRDGRSRAQVEQAILDGVGQCTTGFDPRFVRPYVQMHEFEGLLFSDVAQFQWVLDGWTEAARAALLSIRQAFQSPEDINDSPMTAPSKRLEHIFGKGVYSKPEHGPIIAQEIGLKTIRSQCPQFGAWVSHLENWGQA
jgi:hypothetical protein